MKRLTVFGLLILCLCMGITGCGMTDAQPELQADALPEETVPILPDEVIEEMLDVACPSFSMTDFYGEQWNIADMMGKVLVITFWDDTCTEKISVLNELNAKQGEDGKAIVLTMVTGPTMDVLEADIRDIVAEQHWEIPVMLDDADQSAAKAMEITALPVTFIVDGDGVIRYRNDSIPDLQTLEEQIYNAAAMRAVG